MNIRDIREYTDTELKKELKRRKKQPLQIRKPFWWVCLDWFTTYWFAWSLIFLSPLWFPIWLTIKIHRYGEKARKEEEESSNYSPKKDNLT